MHFEHAASRRKHGDHGPRAAFFPAVGGDDVAVAVEAHAVDAAMRALVVCAPSEQRRISAEAAVCLDRVGAQLARDVILVAAFGDVKRVLVLRNENAVRLRGIERHARGGVSAVFLRVAAQDRLVIDFHAGVRVPVAAVDRIGEPDAALAVDREVVGRIEPFAVKTVGDDGVLAVCVEAYDRTSARAAAEQLPPGVETKPVGAVGAVAHHRDGVALQVVFENGVRMNVRKQQVLAVPDRAFGDGNAFRLHQQFEFPLLHRCLLFKVRAITCLNACRRTTRLLEHFFCPGRGVVNLFFLWVRLAQILAAPGRAVKDYLGHSFSAQAGMKSRRE